jgi:hypothetical protein
VRNSLYYPQSNGLVERFNSSAKQAIRIVVAEGKPPDVAVREMLFAYTPQSAATVSPAQLIGRQFQIPVISLGTRLLLEENREKKTVRLAERATLVEENGQHKWQLDVVRSNVQRHQQKMVAQFDTSHRHSKRPRIQVGDWVRIRVPNRRHKTDTVFSEPHQVKEFVAPFTVRLDNHARWHMSKLKKTTAPDSDVFVLMACQRLVILAQMMGPWTLRRQTRMIKVWLLYLSDMWLIRHLHPFHLVVPPARGLIRLGVRRTFFTIDESV